VTNPFRLNFPGRIRCAVLSVKLLCIIFLFSNFVSCAAAPVKEDTPDPAVFYEALKAENRMDTLRAAELYEKALNNASFKIRREAAGKLGALLPLLPEPEEQAERILKWLEKVKKNGKKKPEQAREVSEPAFIYLKAAALYVTNAYEELDRLYAGKDLSPREKALVILSRPSLRLDELRDFLRFRFREPRAG
jgi:hypothetical protein